MQTSTFAKFSVERQLVPAEVGSELLMSVGLIGRDDF
jgi:hypothetical protein